MTHLKHIIVLLILLLNIKSFSQQWKINNTKIEKNIFKETMPDKYAIFRMDIRALKQKLKSTTHRFSGLVAVSIDFPINIQGNIESFSVYKTTFMEKDLQNKYKNISTYVGKSKSGRSVYFAITPYEASFTVLTPGESTFLIKSYAKDSYIGFSLAHQHYSDNGFVCSIEGNDTLYQRNFASFARANDGILRKYRYAVSVTGEYSTYTLNRLGIASNASVLDKKNAILGAIVISVTRMNSVYERDVAVSLQLVNNNDQLIYLDSATDNFDNDTTSMSSLLYASQNSADNHIGTANYDVGQVWCQGGLQGLARRPAVCENGIKGMGAARGQNVESDRFIISVASHELGHMFGANHTFSNSNCGGSRNDATGIEAGSGTTIMSYAGICSPNIQDFTDDRFNIASMNEIKDNYLLGNSGSCAQNISINNTPPVVTSGSDKFIPINTPFVLEASASDVDGDILTYTWEEFDTTSDPITTPPTPTRTSGPMFRPYPVSSSAKRYFPVLDTLLNNHLSHEWEVLPAVSRQLNFKITVKDNNILGGQSATNSLTLLARESAGPFMVNSDQIPTAWQPNETRTITWDVANTNNPPINCSSVDILLSTDGGNTYTTPLLLNTPNDGSADIIVPNVTALNARYMVKAHENYFFSLNKGKISIGNFENHCETYTNSNSQTITDNDDITGIESIIHINDTYQLAGINVSLNITHTYIQDIKAELVSPNGTTVTLINHSCGSNDNLIATFSDNGQTIDCSSLSTGNVFSPNQPLSVLTGENIQGDWKLKLWDNHAGDEGTLNNWSLELCYMRPTEINSIFLNDFSLYPIPTKDNILISFTPITANQTIIIYDIKGRLMYNKTYNNKSIFNETINLEYFSAGVYLLQVIDGNITINKKIIKY